MACVIPQHHVTVGAANVPTSRLVICVRPAWIGAQKLAARGLPCSATHGSKKPDKVMEGLKDLATYVGPAIAAVTGVEPTGTATASLSRDDPGPRDDWRSPVYALIALLVAVHCIGSIVPLSGWFLGLGAKFRWWQVLTSGFVHTGSMHLAESVFMVYMFGRVMERAHGAWGLWAAYISSAIGASCMAVWLLPATKGTASLALSSGSAAAMGLFVAGLAWRRMGRKPLEVAVLAPWVLGATCARYAAMSSALVVDGRAAGHLVHMLGAFLGASLVAGVLRVVELVREAQEEQRRQQLRQEAEKRRSERSTTDNQAMAEVLESAAKAAATLAKKLL